MSFSQDPQPTFVLDSRRTRLDAMNVAAPNLEAERPENRSSDEELMAAFSRGSMDAFSELFSRYKQPLFGFFRRRLTDPEQAEELTQETFLAVLRASSRYHPSALFRTYLMQSALRSCGCIAARPSFEQRFWARPEDRQRLQCMTQQLRN